MTPAQLHTLIRSQQPDGSHGERNCPKCSKGFMNYRPCGSSSFYSCVRCSWIEFGHPPWQTAQPLPQDK